MFPSSIESHLIETASDHCPILLEILKVTRIRNVGKHPFRLKNIWLSNGKCKEVVSKAWKHSAGVGGLDTLVNTLKICDEELSKWNKDSFGNLQHRIKNAEQKPQKYCLSKLENGGDVKEVYDYRSELEGLFSSEKVFWKQRSKVLWLQGRDRNSRNFHSVATKRRRTNRIDRIVDGTSQWVSSSAMELELVCYYEGMFTLATPHDMDRILQLVERKVTDNMNRDLDSGFTMQEVEIALNDMSCHKSPGPDGFNASFKECWATMGSDLN